MILAAFLLTVVPVLLPPAVSGSPVTAAVPAVDAAPRPSPPKTAAETEPRAEARSKTKGSVTASFLSPDERREESLVITLSPGPAIGPAGAVKAAVERKLTLPPRPKTAKVLFDDVPPGTWALSWCGPGLSSGKRAVVVAAGPVDAGRVEVLRGITVDGAVRDDLGGPVAGARVFLQERMSFDRPDGFLVEVTTAADGGFSIPGTPSDGVLLWAARAAGHMETKGVLGGETRLEVVLDRAQRVSGRLVDPDGLVLRDAKVVVRYVTDASSRNHGGKIEVDAEGVFTFHRELASKARVQVQARGFRQAQRILEPLPQSGWPKEVDLGEIPLDRGRTLRGRTVDVSTGAGIGGVEVKSTIFRKDGRSLVLDQQEGLTDDEGRFELSGLPPQEPVALSARKAGYAPRNLDLGEIGEENEEIEVVLGRGGRVEGRLCGRPFELARSEIWMAGPAGAMSREGAQPVDTSGRFVFAGVETGRRTFIRAFLYESPLRPGSYGAMLGGTKASVVVEEGRTSTVSLGCDGLLFSGVLLHEGAAVANKAITFTGPGGAEPDAMTDSAGVFSLRVPVPGDYEPFTGDGPAPGMTWAPVSCNVPPGGLAGCVLDLRAIPVQTP